MLNVKSDPVCRLRLWFPNVILEGHPPHRKSLTMDGQPLRCPPAFEY